MFLDEELLEICRTADCSETEKIQQLNVDLCKKCEEYYKSKISHGMLKTDVRLILDRTFNLWDSFTRMAIKDGGKVALLGEMFKEHSFKKRLLSNDEMLRIYNSL